MKDVQKPDHVSLTTLVNRLREGRYVIPDFQREFEWKPWDIRDLIRSIFLDYYIGSLLLWKGKPENFEALACEPIYGYDDRGNDPTHIVLDGQQRLTAMYYVFLAPDFPLPNRSNRFLFFIHVDRFMDQIYDDAFEYNWTSQGINLLRDQTAQFESHMFPLSVVGQGGWELPNWVQGYEKYWQDKADQAAAMGDSTGADVAHRHRKDAHDFGEHLKGITEQYQIAYIELDRDLELDKICDIFTQINSRGIRLDVFDLINALLKPKGLQLKLLWRKAEPLLDFIQTERMNVYVLQVMSILRQGYCSPKYLYYLLPGQQRQLRGPDGSLHKDVLIPSTDDFEIRWTQAVDSIQRAISLLRHPQEYGAVSSQYLPYVSILPAFAANWATARGLPANRQLDAARKIRHWYWASVFTNRYSGSVESTTARDYLDVKAWFDDDSAEPALIAEFKSRFKALELRRETKRGTSVYNGVFNLLVLKGARDWMSGTIPQYGDLDDHHIVPKDWGKQHQLGTAIDTILNRTPLTAETNRNAIRDRLPNVYLPELVAENGEASVRSILESHFISPVAFDILLRKDFSPSDFDDFLAERQRTLQEAIEDLLIKERLDLAPQLRDLDAQIETVELLLRQTVADSVEGDADLLPPHVLQKIDERLQSAARRNPALDLDRYKLLANKLEYADLREIEACLTSKILWPRFAAVFANKDNVVKRFNQLSELRNGIRHSRAVDDVTRKEGEAAIIWFQDLVGRR
jgi:hypothetical protein